MSYTELESGYQDLRQSTTQHQQQQQQQQQAQAAAAAAAARHHAQCAASVGGAGGGMGAGGGSHSVGGGHGDASERQHQRPGFFLGHDGDPDLCESNDGMDSDCSSSSNYGKQVLVGICAMAKKTQSKPMKEILTRLQEFEFIKMVIFEEDVILKEPVENWPLCDCLVSFHSKGFPLEKAIQYAQLRKPFVLNNLHMQYDIQDRRRVYAILEKEGIEIPRYAVLDRDSPDPKQHELIESEDHVEVNGIVFNKPFVEKPVSAEDHNIYIYYPTSAGGGSQRLFRKIGSRSSVYSPESRVRKTGSFIYEDFMPTDGTDVKVYTVGPDYAHAEARKSPALDGKVERDSEGKEIRYPVILNHAEKLISRQVCLAFKQTVCGFDLLRANGKSYVCDVNGFSFVKNSNKYYDDCAKILGNMILRELTPTLHIPWSVPFQLDDPPIVPTTFGKMMELRCVVAVIRHGDRTPKQKMKVEVRHPKFFEIFAKYDGYKHGHVKLKRPKQLQEILDIARYLLAEIQTKSAEVEIEEKQSKLEQLKSVLEMYGHFSGINRKVQMKYQPRGRPRGSSSDDGNTVKNYVPKEPSLVLILKWGGELTPAGRIQAEELGRIFRCMYPGGQGRQDYSGTQGLGLLRLHSTFRHDLKIYASDEGRVQMTAAAFAKGLLALEGELTPILVQMVKSANTNGLLDNDCDSSKYQNMAKNRLHELMQVDRDFTPEDRLAINPGDSISINQALDFVKNPVECCNHVHILIKELLTIISIKKDDPKTKDAILYHGETWDLMARRWEKIEKDFSTKSKLFDISKIPDIYDCIKYDLQHNQHTLQYDQAEELYIYAKYLADIVIPQEYGLTIQEKMTIGQGICTPLLKKIKADLQRNIEEVGDESVNRLNPQYSHGVASPERHVRTRLYFTSESHVHSLLTVLRHGGLLNLLTDEQWRRAMDYISMVSELNYMSQIVIMLYEDPTKDPTSEERFHVELHFSPGVNCCVQKNLPPGPGFRPHSRNDSGHGKGGVDSDEGLNNPPRIDEENDTDESPNCSADASPEERTTSSFRHSHSSRHLKSKPIPIGSHHTVAGHEAMDLAKRLNEELASQSKGAGSLETPRPVSPDSGPRSRSYEQRQPKPKEEEAKQTSPSPEPLSSPPMPVTFSEISTKHSASPLHRVRVTDKVTFFKITSSTNELPLSDIDFSLNPGTPDYPIGPHGPHKSPELGHPKSSHLLTMHRMESHEESDYQSRVAHLPKITPMATNERPLSCNCSGGSGKGPTQFAAPHSHSKSMYNIKAPSSLSDSALGDEDFPSGMDDYFQLSSSAPSLLMRDPVKPKAPPKEKRDPLLSVGSPTNSPTASTLRLCVKMEADSLEHHEELQRRHTSFSGKSACGFNMTLRRSSSLTRLAKGVPQNAEAALTPLPVSQPLPELTVIVIPDVIVTQHPGTPTDRSSPPPSITPPPPPPATSTSSSSTPSSPSPTNLSNMPCTNQMNTNPIYPSPPSPSIPTPTPPDNAHNDTNTANVSNTCSLNSFSSAAAAALPCSSSPSTTTTTCSFIVTPPMPMPLNCSCNMISNNNNNITSTPESPTDTYLNTSTTTTTNTTTSSTSTTTAADGNGTPVSSSSSVSSRRQRHSIAGQMSYMKMLGFGGFSKKLATSSSSLFSTAVISGSSSAPNLRDMIPCAVSSSVLEGFGGVPPIRPLETLHNALSLKQLDNFLQQMTSAPLFKTPASSPPKNPSTPTPHVASSEIMITPTNYYCDCQVDDDLDCTCGRLCGPQNSRAALGSSASGASTRHLLPAISTECANVTAQPQEPPPAQLTTNTGSMWSKQSSLASSTEPSSPAISDSLSHDTNSGDMSISLTSTDGYNILPAAEELAKFFPQLDDDLNSVSVYTPMNADSLEVETEQLSLSACGSVGGEKSACLTPVSFGVEDVSMIANKGSMTLSVDGFEDEDETTLSAATTPSLPPDDIKVETCYCCPTHAEQAEPPDVDIEGGMGFTMPTPLSIPQTKVIHSSPEATPARPAIRKALDPVSPKIQKQISLFESSEYMHSSIGSSSKELTNLHASINIPASSQQLKHDARLRKFENLTQSTSNSNFPFESNTLKRLPPITNDLVDVTHTQSCLNLKTNRDKVAVAPPVAATSQYKLSTYPPDEMEASGSTVSMVNTRPGALIVKEKFIEPPQRITRSFHTKTQSMDADFLFNEFLLVPALTPTAQLRQVTGSSGSVSSANTSPSSRPGARFTATKIVDDLEMLKKN